MPRIAYVSKRFADASLVRIEQANAIIAEYRSQGFDLTLRQLYYQFVARDLIPNNQRSYNNLGSLISDARLAGLVDWNAIQDRTRFVRSNSHWDSPTDIIEAFASQYRIDRWEHQPYRPEVWIEKDALVGVIEGVCRELDVPYFSCRGYTSQSEMWRAAQRMIEHYRAGQMPIVFHLGDHDPSGIDMSRDIRDRLQLFLDCDLDDGCDLEFRRLALNMDQVEQYDPPPNPAKITDSRAHGYMTEYGTESWELDALEPQAMAGLIRSAVAEIREDSEYHDAVDREETDKRLLGQVAGHWDTVVATIEDAEH